MPPALTLLGDLLLSGTCNAWRINLNYRFEKKSSLGNAEHYELTLKIGKQNSIDFYAVSVSKQNICFCLLPSSGIKTLSCSERTCANLALVPHMSPSGTSFFRILEDQGTTVVINILFDSQYHVWYDKSEVKVVDGAKEAEVTEGAEAAQSAEAARGVVLHPLDAFGGSERLRLVGNFCRWKLNAQGLLLEPVPVPVGAQWQEHRLCARLHTGRMEFQIVSDQLGFQWRLYPPAKTLSKLCRGNSAGTAAAEATVGGPDDGHGLNFEVEEEPLTTVTISVWLQDHSTAALATSDAGYSCTGARCGARDVLSEDALARAYEGARRLVRARVGYTCKDTGPRVAIKDSEIQFPPQPLDLLSYEKLKRASPKEQERQLEARNAIIRRVCVQLAREYAHEDVQKETLALRRVLPHGGNEWDRHGNLDSGMHGMRNLALKGLYGLPGESRSPPPPAPGAGSDAVAAGREAPLALESAAVPLALMDAGCGSGPRREAELLAAEVPAELAAGNLPQRPARHPGPQLPPGEVCGLFDFEDLEEELAGGAGTAAPGPLPAPASTLGSAPSTPRPATRHFDFDDLEMPPVGEAEEGSGEEGGLEGCAGAPAVEEAAAEAAPEVALGMLGGDGAALEALQHMSWEVWALITSWAGPLVQEAWSESGMERIVERPLLTGELANADELWRFLCLCSAADCSKDEQSFFASRGGVAKDEDLSFWRGARAYLTHMADCLRDTSRADGPKIFRLRLLARRAALRAEVSTTREAACAHSGPEAAARHAQLELQEEQVRVLDRTLKHLTWHDHMEQLIFGSSDEFFERAVQRLPSVKAARLRAVKAAGLAETQASVLKALALGEERHGADPVIAEANTMSLRLLHVLPSAWPETISTAARALEEQWLWTGTPHDWHGGVHAPGQPLGAGLVHASVEVEELSRRNAQTCRFGGSKAGRYWVTSAEECFAERLHSLGHAIVEARETLRAILADLGEAGRDLGVERRALVAHHVAGEQLPPWQEAAGAKSRRFTLLLHLSAGPRCCCCSPVRARISGLA